MKVLEYKVLVIQCSSFLVSSSSVTKITDSESWDQEIEKDLNFSVAAGDTFEDQPLPLKTTVHFHQFSKKFY